MPEFSKTSWDKLKLVDKRLQEICNEAIKIFDFSVVWGYRDQESQEKAFVTGHSKLRWPDSKHNKNPSLAVDIVPYRNGIQFNDREAYCILAGVMMAIAHSKGISLRWGGDWNRNNTTTDERYADMAHFEIVE